MKARIDRLFTHGYITADEWKKQLENYEERLFKLYKEGRITEEQLLERIDK